MVQHVLDSIPYSRTHHNVDIAVKFLDRFKFEGLFAVPWKSTRLSAWVVQCSYRTPDGTTRVAWRGVTTSPAMKLEHMRSLAVSGRNVFEVVVADRPCHLFVDLDRSIGDREDAAAVRSSVLATLPIIEATIMLGFRCDTGNAVLLPLSLHMLASLREDVQQNQRSCSSLGMGEDFMEELDCVWLK